jgi:hypothetical protein
VAGGGGGAAARRGGGASLPYPRAPAPRYECELEQWTALAKKYAPPAEAAEEDAEDLDDALLDAYDARAVDAAPASAACDAALSHLDVIARGFRAVARRMVTTQAAAAQASMAFRASEGAADGLVSGAGDPKALLRQLGTGAATSAILSPRRLLADVSARTAAVISGAGK